MKKKRASTRDKAGASGRQQDWRASVLHDMADALKPYRVEVPAQYRACTEPDKLYHGECFARAFDFLNQLGQTLKVGHPVIDNLWLVHGEYMGWHRHALVELPDGIVFDGNFQEFYARDGYYETAHMRPWYKYAYWAAQLVAANMPLNPDGTIPLGEWHTFLKLPFADPNNPTLVDDDYAEQLIQAAGLTARRWLCSLGVRRPGLWMSAAEWAQCVARLRRTSVFVPEADRRTAAGRTRGIERVLEANLRNTLVAETRNEYLTMRLEKRAQGASPPRYRFALVGRRTRRLR